MKTADMNALVGIDVDRLDAILHGTTIATNAVIERTGAEQRPLLRIVEGRIPKDQVGARVDVEDVA